MSAGSGVPLIRSQPKEEATPASWQPRPTHRPKKMQRVIIHPSIHSISNPAAKFICTYAADPAILSSRW
jgi:hypothetical protein